MSWCVCVSCVCVWCILCTSNVPLDNGYKINFIRSLLNRPLAIFRCRCRIYERTHQTMKSDKTTPYKMRENEKKELTLFNTQPLLYTIAIVFVYTEMRDDIQFFCFVFAVVIVMSLWFIQLRWFMCTLRVVKTKKNILGKAYIAFKA